ncbi:uncharacterized protein E0L32_007300 [Thyridium curvatum]|uniref:COP9 signalosome complex subunit 6 n=1 Tax=Thyridium curvatum TaxID=1093900 RepID=A0A507AWZ0_9PEZI|nr:uncharacterized protein E0L32_007300 [Thyridium curvatum]TPX11997.1 hypothetical protein E0L32_007300 [Thyridium curvatum]
MVGYHPRPLDSHSSARHPGRPKISKLPVSHNHVSPFPGAIQASELSRRVSSAPQSQLPLDPSTMADEEANPLISTQKSSDSLQAALHPLVLLTISDYITRHTLRQQSGSVVGALLGQQNGREITLEHAFDCRTTTSEGGDVILDKEWFDGRLDQMRQVHKDRQLDLVGWYTLLPTTGPTPDILPLHNQILSGYNESAVLLAFHPESVPTDSVGGKLPISIYESNYEVDDASKAKGEDASSKGGDGDQEMKDGNTQEQTLKLKFRHLPYSVETGEAEMISIDFVAKGATNAAATDSAEKKKKKKPSQGATETKGKQLASGQDTDASDVNDLAALSREEEELIASITTRANAVKMLHSRIQLVTKYLEQLPPSYLATEGQAPPEAAPGQPHTTPSHTILRSIQALVNRLPILQPASTEAFEREMQSEANDVHLIALTDQVMQSIKEIREIGRKFSIVEQGRNQSKRLPDVNTPGGTHGFSLPGAGDIIM